MRTLILLVALLAACGRPPLCDDEAKRVHFLDTCANGNAPTLPFCECAWDYLADRRTCSELDDQDIDFPVRDRAAADACISSR